ncbi:MAG TPA: HAD family phosphatase [Bryobacteraceae bacterium]|jgi:putative hydrolase of the HAD superfamily
MALVSEYQGVIFDFGGVLVAHQNDADQARLAALAGISPTKFFDLYWSYRLDYDKGLVSNVEYWQTVARNGGSTLTPDTIDQLTHLDNESWMQFDPSMWEWVGQLRSAGKPVAMLSNMPRDLGEALRKTDRLEQFDYVTLSYEARSAKPEPAIYEHCLAGLGTPPGKTLFLDDRMPNVEAAEKLGIRAVHFVDRDEVLAKLRGYY